MHPCTSCQGRCPTFIDLHRDLALYLFPQCVYDISDPKRFPDDKNMLPLTVVSVLVIELKYFMVTTPLECML